MKIRSAVLAAFLLLAASAAGAAELRPLSQRDMCLDGGTEIRPGINAIKLAPCSDKDDQNFRTGRRNVISVGQLCLQAFAVQGQEEVGVVATRCHGQDGQRWILTRDGRLTSGDRLCLTVDGQGASAKLSMSPCKEASEDQTNQKWAVHGKF